MKKSLKLERSFILASLALMSSFVALGASAEVEPPVCPPKFGEPGFFQLNDQGKIELSVVLDAPGLSKDQLYNTAKSWYFELVESAESAKGLPRGQLTIDDKELGELKSVGVALPYRSSRVPNIRVNLQILVRDGEAEISVSDLFVYYFIKLTGSGSYSPLSAEKFFHVRQPQKRYKKKTGEMVKVRRLECEDLVESGSSLVESLSVAIERALTTEEE